MFDVITRKIDYFRLWLADMQLPWFNPIIFQDAQWHLHGIVLLLAFGFAYLKNAHVRVDIFREKLPRRGQAWVEFLGMVLLGIPFLLLISYFAFQFVEMSFHQNEGSESLTGIPKRYFIKSFMVFGFLLLLSSFIATALRLWVYLKGSPQDSAEAAEAQLEIFATELAPLDTDTATDDFFETAGQGSAGKEEAR